MGSSFNIQRQTILNSARRKGHRKKRPDPHAVDGAPLNNVPLGSIANHLGPLRPLYKYLFDLIPFLSGKPANRLNGTASFYHEAKAFNQTALGRSLYPEG